MSKPVQFSTPFVKNQTAMQRFEERSLKVAGYSTMGFMATVGVGFLGSCVALATRGRMPSARFFNAWEKTIQVTGVGLVAGASANAVANAAMRSQKNSFVNPRSSS